MSRVGGGGHERKGSHLYSRVWPPGRPSQGEGKEKGNGSLFSGLRTGKVKSNWGERSGDEVGGLRMGLERKTWDGPENQFEKRQLCAGDR